MTRLGCDACYFRERVASAAKRWAAATPKAAAEYGDGMVFVENESGGGWGREGWFSSIDHFRDAVGDWRDDHPGEPLPTLYVYGSTPRKMSLDAGDVIENALDDFHEGAWDEIGRVAIAELQAQLHAWAEKNGPTTNDIDYNMKIVGWE